MADKNKEPQKTTSMFGEGGFDALVDKYAKTPIYHELEEDKSIYSFPDTITDEELEDYTIEMGKEKKYRDLVQKSQDEYRKHPKIGRAHV